MKILRLCFVFAFSFLIGHSVLRAQNRWTSILGCGIEAGIGQNNLYWRVSNGLMDFGCATIDRKYFFPTPDARVYIRIHLSKKIFIQLFEGYSIIGGRSDEGDKYRFEIIESGLFAQYKYSYFGLGPGIKVNRISNVKYYSDVVNEDRSDWFTNHSFSTGLRLSYFINKVSINSEVWFGIKNLADGPLATSKVYENHYRLLLGICI